MPTLDATAGGTAANSYVSVADADAYFDGTLYTDDWFDAGDEDKARALITATRMLDTWYDWQGAITSVSQVLGWPRSGVLRPNVAEGASNDAISNPWHEPFGVFLHQNEIPTLIVQATCEQAIALITANRQADSDIEAQALRSLTAGPVSLEFGSSSAAKPIPDTVMALASRLGSLRSKYGVGAVSILRG